MSILSNTFKAGKLFLWQGTQRPQLMKLPQNIYKASVGVDHIVAIGESGNLYSYGSGNDGKLGHGDTRRIQEFKMIDYFAKNNIKIKDAVAGEKHTIALSQSGEVYTWGYGRKNALFPLSLFMNMVGPTGHGKDIPAAITKPAKVKALQGMKIQRIAAGRNFCIVFNDKKEVYNWGNGEYAAFGDGNNKNYHLPAKNQHFEYLLGEEKMRVKKIKSCETYSVALMDNGKLYGWGSNEHGQIGIKAEIGLEMYQTVNFVSEVIRDGFEDKKVVNFDISDSLLIFELENGELWWNGMKIAYKPQKINIDVKSKLFAAGSRAMVIVDNENNVYSRNFFGFKVPEDLESIKTGFVKCKGSELFQTEEILAIGGEYQRRYAIVS